MSAVRPLPPEEPASTEHEPLPFRALEMVGYCRHCGCEISIQRFTELQACSRCCSASQGWRDSDDCF